MTCCLHGSSPVDTPGGNVYGQMRRVCDAVRHHARLRRGVLHYLHDGGQVQHLARQSPRPLSQASSHTQERLRLLTN